MIRKSTSTQREMNDGKTQTAAITTLGENASVAAVQNDVTSASIKGIEVPSQ